MKRFYTLFVIFSLIAIAFMSFKQSSSQVSFKGLVQLTNYTGEGAYIAVSLTDKNGNYIKTLQVFGKDKRWYDELTTWYKHYTSSKANVDAITGASITAGSRKVFSFSVDEVFFNKGYKLRFETSVEDQNYKERDVELDFSQINIGKTINGKGYIRYVKLFQTTNQ